MFLVLVLIVFNLCTRCQATEAQVKFMQTYPEMAAQLGQMARMM